MSLQQKRSISMQQQCSALLALYAGQSPADRICLTDTPCALQLLSWVFSYDGVHATEPLAIISASAALAISGVAALYHDHRCLGSWTTLYYVFTCFTREHCFSFIYVLLGAYAVSQQTQMSL